MLPPLLLTFIATALSTLSTSTTARPATVTPGHEVHAAKNVRRSSIRQEKEGQHHQQQQHERDLMFEQATIEWGLDRVDSLGNRNGVYNYDFQGNGVLVYLLDSGVDASHHDFRGPTVRVLTGYTVYPPSQVGQPGNTDTYGHGTHVASTIAGNTYGIAKQATIIPVRVLGSDGTGSFQGLSDGLDWAIQDAATRNAQRKIINLSLEAPWNSAVDAKMAQARQAGFVLVAAAGNSKEDACLETPGGSKYVISVGSIASVQQSNGYVDQISGFSNWGPCVTLFAPGSLIPGAEAGHEYEDIYMSGTSMASPHVAGIASLVWSKYPGWTNEQVIARISAEEEHDSINLSFCATKSAGTGCVAVTTNALVQAPFAEVLLVGTRDTVFTMADYGTGPSFWPRLQAPAVLFSTNTCNPPASSPTAMQGAFAVIDFSSCPATQSAYSMALKAQVAGAIAVAVVHPSCRSYANRLMSFPAMLTQDLLQIPVVCVPTSESQSTSMLLTATGGSPMIQLGLVRPGVTAGPAPWIYVAPGTELNQAFTEWRVDWSGAGNGMSAGSLCFEFNAQAMMSGGNVAQILVAISSKQQFELYPNDAPIDPTYTRYVLRSSMHGSVDILKDNTMGYTAPGAGETTFNTSVHFYFRVGVFGPRMPWAVEFGHATSTGDVATVLARFQDPSPLHNVDYFSFSASGGTVLFSAIHPCAGPLGSGLGPIPQTGSGGGGVPTTATPTTTTSTRTSVPTPAVIRTGHPSTSQPTSHPIISFNTRLCNSLSSGPAKCRGRSNHMCKWWAGRCVPKSSSG